MSSVYVCSISIRRAWQRTDKQGLRRELPLRAALYLLAPEVAALGRVRDQLGARRGRNIGVVAAARELITLVFYGLRDQHIRCLPPRTHAA